MYDYETAKQVLIDNIAAVDTTLASLRPPGSTRLPPDTGTVEWDSCLARLQTIRVLCPSVGGKLKYNYYWRAEHGYPYPMPAGLVSNPKRAALYAAFNAAVAAQQALWVDDQDAALNALQGTMHAYRKRIVASTLAKTTWGYPP